MLEDFAEPVYLPGLFTCRAGADASVVLYASNKATISFDGEGVFSVERFEGVVDETVAAEDERIETESRMIFGMRRGKLLIDTRLLGENSRFMVETPVGRISFVNAVVHLNIQHDNRKGTYDFSLSASDGMVRFIDMRNEIYTIFAGQRLSGAGSYSAPAIEGGEQTPDIRDDIETFTGLVENWDFDAIDRKALLSHTLTLRDYDERADVSQNMTETSGSDPARRPLIIDYAPRAEYLTPFRGEVKPPAAWQADLF